MLEDSRLRIFATLAEEGNFTRAARRLRISQPAVSQSISELEKQLGVKLFERTRAAATLTPEGTTFRNYASEILKWYDAAATMFAMDGKATVRRPLVVRCGAFAAETIIPPLLCDNLGITADTFTLRLVPEEEAAAARGDLVIFTTGRKDSLDIEEASSLAGTVAAAAGSRDENADPAFAPLAIWRPYEKLLGADYLARVTFSSDAPETVVRTAARVNGMVCLVPYPCLKGSGLQILPVPLPHLQQDVHIRFGNALETTGLAAVLKRKLLSLIT